MHPVTCMVADAQHLAAAAGPPAAAAAVLPEDPALALLRAEAANAAATITKVLTADQKLLAPPTVSRGAEHVVATAAGAVLHAAAVEVAEQLTALQATAAGAGLCPAMCTLPWRLEACGGSLALPPSPLAAAPAAAAAAARHDTALATFYLLSPPPSSSSAAASHSSASCRPPSPASVADVAAAAASPPDTELEGILRRISWAPPPMIATTPPSQFKLLAPELAVAPTAVTARASLGDAMRRAVDSLLGPVGASPPPLAVEASQGSRAPVVAAAWPVLSEHLAEELVTSLEAAAAKVAALEEEVGVLRLRLVAADGKSTATAAAHKSPILAGLQQQPSPPSKEQSECRIDNRRAYVSGDASTDFTIHENGAFSDSSSPEAVLRGLDWSLPTTPSPLQARAATSHATV
eukprot:SM000120S25713  [mRNA]  locus=s120:339730:341549:+ [translate_table: standard]